MLYCYFCLLFYLIYSYYWGIVLVFLFRFVVSFLSVEICMFLSYVLCTYFDSWSCGYVVDCSSFPLFLGFGIWYFPFIIIFDDLSEFGICFVFLLISLFILSPLVVDLHEYEIVLLFLLICIICTFYCFCRTVIFNLLELYFLPHFISITCR